MGNPEALELHTPSQEHKRASRRELANIWFDAVGIRPFTDLEKGIIHEQCVAELGVKHTHVSTFETGERASLIPGSISLVFEIGGTNVRAFYLRVKEDGTTEKLLNPATNKEIDIEIPFSGNKFKSREEFYDTIVDLVHDDVLAYLNWDITPQAVGVVFSFPHETDANKDAIAQKDMSKDFVVPGIEEVPVGKGIIEALRKRCPTVAEDITVVVGNDIIDIMVPDFYISVINGTGLNIGTVVMMETEYGPEYNIANLQSGEVDNVPMSLFEQLINQNSQLPGKYQTETIAAGKGLEMQLKRVVMQLQKMNFIPYEIEQKAVNLALLDSAIRKSPEDIARVQMLIPGLTEADADTWDILTDLALRLRERSAEIVVQELAVVIEKSPYVFPDNHVVCSATGSVFWKVPGYAQIVKEKIEALLPGYTIDFVKVKGGIGMGYAALREYARKLKIPSQA